MIALLSTEARDHARVRAALPDEVQLSTVTSWEPFERAAVNASALIALVRWAAPGETDAGLARLKRCFPLKPLVVVLDKDADVVRHLRSTPIDELVWMHELHRELWSAVRRASARSFHQTVISALGGATHLPPKLREALTLAVRGERPPRSLKDLAALARCSRSTIWYHWRNVVRRESGLRLEDYLDWLVLLHALARKRHNATWIAAAVEVGVHEHTLGRLARRLLGVTLRDVESGDREDVTRLFMQRVLRPLLDGTDPRLPAAPALGPGARA